MSFTTILCSQAVTHPSTNYARRCLTSVIGRELVYSTWYGRWRWKQENSYVIAAAEPIRLLIEYGDDE
ncbi:Uncharacterized protein FWK35_00003631 [Aphis craccivora]|uniref:Uncharacterized protein n=1 Tax=Aphis craccivora TaxID=307492 RepID=A0A6G0ZMW0_APHCR|nr:Uncharacterized protein FWK35_00003631 [Aphis craccivora]